MLVDPRNGPDHDLPPVPPVRHRTWAVASVPRSGSTLLCRLLWDTGRVGAPKEYLNPTQVRDWEVRLGSTAWTRWRHRALTGRAVGLAGRGWWPDARLRDLLDRVRGRRTGPTGWFGLKIHHHHLRHWFLDRGRDPEAPEWLGPTRWVRIRRRDRVAQAVSWTRALQTHAWAAEHRPRARPRYRRRAIARRLVAIEAQERGWDAYLSARGHEPVELVYEDLVADPAAAVRAVLTALGEPAEVAGGPLPMRRQADHTSAVWAARFRMETGGL